MCGRGLQEDGECIKCALNTNLTDSSRLEAKELTKQAVNEMLTKFKDKAELHEEDKDKELEGSVNKMRWMYNFVEYLEQAGAVRKRLSHSGAIRLTEEELLRAKGRRT